VYGSGEIRVENPVVPVFRWQLVGHTTQSMGISGQIVKGTLHRSSVVCAIWANEELLWSGT
jgi:hypothetical protein